MDVIDAIVSKYKEVSIIMDKKIRKHGIGHDKYILDDRFQTRLTNKRWKK
ncbi:MAG: hypothetical protein ACXVH2_06875 [Methanobacterium sp.]